MIKDHIEIIDAHENNLKHVNVEIPKGRLVVVAGVSGSGKSSLAVHELPRRYPEAIVIDQRPIGTSIRSTPATYTGVMDDIRRLFAEANGVDAGWFSFNSKGACPVCKGTGQITYDMAFAEPVVVVCEECRGRLYILDEPSTGLHAKNIELLVSLLRRLVSEGNTVVIVEHRLELIAQADWIIDMGPDGGTSGGEVVFQGTPQEIIHCERSKTGRYLRNLHRKQTTEYEI